MTEFPTRPVAQLVGSNGPIHALTYSSTPSTYILTGSSDRSIRLYNPSSTTQPPTGTGPPTGRLIQTYTGAHSYEVLSLSVSSQNDRFASSGGDRTVFLWDVSTATTLRRFGSNSTTSSHTGRVNTVLFSGHDDSLVISGGHDTTVRIWDTKSSSAKPIQVLNDAKDAITCLATPLDGEPEIISGSVDGKVRSYDVRMGRCVTDVLGTPVTSLSLSRDAKTLLVGGLDSKIRLLDRMNGTCLKTYQHAGWRNTDLRVQSCLGGKERYVVAGDELTSEAGVSSSSSSSSSEEEGKIWVWDLLSGKLVATVPVPWGGDASNKKVTVGRDGKERARKNVVSCVAWKEAGFGNQFCVGGTSGVVNVYGEL
ncbi:putative mitogen-activated protein kinase organizer 1 [Triangularia verruculosa]|uniref:Mitogen-activated protein kinase organizer 1 n=1 Tax=Triangularia verruculosa TaxID=2587418 RepID=A0AAN7AY35_9PEZI|nr:putative mitogen-activated protein kinase organizer 1 [Triangularia verruculosa]